MRWFDEAARGFPVTVQGRGPRRPASVAAFDVSQNVQFFCLPLMIRSQDSFGDFGGYGTMPSVSLKVMYTCSDSKLRELIFFSG